MDDGISFEFGELSEELQSSVKSELVPGERLLWVARSSPGAFKIGRGQLFWSMVAVGLLTGSGVCFAVSAGYVGPRNFQRDGSAVAFGLLSGVFGLITLIGVIANWRSRRQARTRRLNTIYALTDRRAIIRAPHQETGGVEVHTIGRGELERIHRVEYPDGSGSVILAEDRWPKIAFEEIPDVRRIEDLARRVLEPSPRNRAHRRPIDSLADDFEM